MNNECYLGFLYSLLGKLYMNPSVGSLANVRGCTGLLCASPNRNSHTDPYILTSTNVLIFQTTEFLFSPSDGDAPMQLTHKRVACSLMSLTFNVLMTFT